MVKDQRGMARRDLDECQMLFRKAWQKTKYRRGWLRTIRQALGVPVAEIAAKLGVNRSVIFRMEAREFKRTVSLKTLDKMAEAMGCEVVFTIVPQRGMTLVELAEERLWRKRMGME
jgi:predicted DNA-binding mobile mystery protein A